MLGVFRIAIAALAIFGGGGGALGQKILIGESTYGIVGELKPKGQPVGIAHCFWGVGFRASRCEHESDNWYDINPGMTSAPIHWKSKFSGEGEYCIECCDNSRLEKESDEAWKLKCDISAADSFTSYVTDKNIIQKFENGDDFEFRFARRNTYDEPIQSPRCPKEKDLNETSGFDFSDITCCSLERQHDSDAYKRTNETRNHIYGYKVTIYVTERNQGFRYWRGVSKCHAEALEVSHNDSLKWKGQHFQEIIRLVTTSSASRFAAQANIFALLGAAAFAVLALT